MYKTEELREDLPAKRWIDIEEGEVVGRAIWVEEMKLTGIYFLIHNNKIVYIGQSVNVHQRIWQHRDKVFEKVFVIRCNEKSLDRLERKCIRKFKPKYNGGRKRLRKGTKFLAKSVAKKATLRKN